MPVALSVLLAVLAATSNAVASVLQRKAAQRSSVDAALSVRILWELVHQPVWLAGISAIAIGFAFQAAALSTGPILLIQPLLVVELSLTLVFSSFLFHSRLGRREWLAVLGMSVGVALLLVAFSPTGGDEQGASPVAWAVGCGITVAVTGTLVMLGRRSRDERRAAYLGIATGIWFGFNAALVSAAFQHGLTGVVGAWQTWTILVVGPLGFVLLQNALQAGRLVASQPGLTLSNPLAAVGWGVAVFGEQVRDGWWILGQVGGAALVAASTVLLARSPLLQGTDGETEQANAGRQGKRWG